MNGRRRHRPLGQLASTPSFGPVQVTRASAVAWAIALRIVQGDVSRLRVEPDGTVVVINRSRRGTAIVRCPQ